MIIGISGKKRTGKDSAARYLIARYGGIQLAFADKLKRWATQIVYDCTGDAIDPWHGKTDAVIAFLQRFGQAGRRYRADFWIAPVIRDAQAALAGGEPYVYITDVRYPNEVTAIQAAGGLVVRLARPEPDRRADCLKLDGPLSAETFADTSETALDGYTGFDGAIFATLLDDLHFGLAGLMAGFGLPALPGSGNPTRDMLVALKER